MFLPQYKKDLIIDTPNTDVATVVEHASACCSRTCETCTMALGVKIVLLALCLAFDCH